MKTFTSTANTVQEYIYEQQQLCDHVEKLEELIEFLICNVDSSTYVDAIYNEDFHEILELLGYT